MRHINHLLLFIASLGGLVHKSTEDDMRLLLEKTADANAPIYVTLQKDAGAVIRAGRIAAGVSEGVVMKAFNLDPTKEEDQKAYMDFESGTTSDAVQITVDSLSAVSKALKANPVELAVKIINSNAGVADPAANPNPDPNATPNPDPNAAKNEKNETLGMQIAKKLTPEENQFLNSNLLKSKQAKGDATPQVVIQKSAEDLKLEKAQKVGASILGLKERENSQLIKSGIVVETDFSPSDTNNPTLGRDLFEIAAPQMAILKDVQTVVMSSYSQEVLVVGKNSRTAVQLTVGTEETTGQMADFINSSKKVEAADMDWVMALSDKTGLQYQGNLPGLDNTVSQMFQAQIATEPEDLGLNGTTDTYASSFTTIRKGWYKQAVDLATGPTAWRLIDLSTGIGSGAITTIMGAMDACISVHRTNNPAGLTSQHVFVMSPADFGKYEAEYIADRKSDDTLTNGAPLKYRGYEIRVSPFAQDSKLIFTWLKNLVFAYVNAPGNGLRVDRRRITKGLKIQVSLGVGYTIVDPNSMVVTQA